MHTLSAAAAYIISVQVHFIADSTLVWLGLNICCFGLHLALQTFKLFLSATLSVKAGSTLNEEAY